MFIDYNCAVDLVEVTPPTSTPISVADLRAHLGLGTSEFDARLQDLVDAATARLDGPTGILGRALVTQTWTIHYDYAFPAWRISLPLLPLISVSSVQYVDSSGVTQTVSASDYQVLDGPLGALIPAYGKAWPAPRAQPRAVSITFVAGYANAAAVPADIRTALKMLGGHLFHNTGDFEASGALPPAVSALLAPYRARRLA